MVKFVICRHMGKKKTKETMDVDVESTSTHITCLCILD